MATTQSEDPDEKVHHPRHYNQHSSGIETIELIEHLPYNLGAAVKYIWRCGLKASEKPGRDLRSARWYTDRESHRVELFELDSEPKPKTEIVWRSLARKVLDSANRDDLLSEYLAALLADSYVDMLEALDAGIHELGDADF